MIAKMLQNLTGARCCGPEQKTTEQATGTIALVGQPNVGKSVLFANLTGTYVAVSNYPGTTVEVARGTAELAGRRFQVVDTPGMYSLLPLSEEERVARDILVDEQPDVIVQVGDARNLERTLTLTFQLMETGFPLVLALNMMDEARAAGLSLDTDRLSEALGMPVVPTVSVTREGMDELREAIGQQQGRPAPVEAVRYAPREGVDIEEAVQEVEGLLEGDYRLSPRCLALLLLQGDEQVHERVQRTDTTSYPRIAEVVDEVTGAAQRPLDYTLTVQRRHRAQALSAEVTHAAGERRDTLRDRLSDLMTRPLTGLPILAVVLYFAFYQFVGVFGADVVVHWIEDDVFDLITPPFASFVETVLPWQVWQELVIGDYGLWTLGLRYAVGIILPIVTFFFLVFALFEDVGYLPRLALLLDRTFKKIGLSGRAVIPMVLGFGCDTMATMVTRTLNTKRERLISIILLSVAVPCSAQLGVIMALLSGVPGALLLWAGVMLAVYLGVGAVAARVLPGRAEPFYVEVPPLRLPRLRNVLAKTFARVKWYFVEILPLFLIASVLIWLGQLTGIFGLIIGALEHPVRWIGLPAETAAVFLLGFFRRDYGAAGLYDIHQTVGLSGRQLVVSAVALTLFLPCIAHFLVTARERGWRTGLAIGAMVLAISFSIAFALNQVLTHLGALA